MGKDSTAKLEKAKKARKTASLSSCLSAGRAAGDWIPSRVMKRRLEELAKERLITADGWRLFELWPVGGRAVGDWIPS